MPGYSDFEHDIRQLGEHLGTYRMIQRVEILPYHTLGVHKYEAMDKEYLLKGVKENTPEQIEKAEKLFRQYFRTVQINELIIKKGMRVYQESFQHRGHSPIPFIFLSLQRATAILMKCHRHSD